MSALCKVQASQKALSRRTEAIAVRVDTAAKVASSLISNVDLSSVCSRIVSVIES